MSSPSLNFIEACYRAKTKPFYANTVAIYRWSLTVNYRAAMLLKMWTRCLVGVVWPSNHEKMHPSTKKRKKVETKRNRENGKETKGKEREIVGKRKMRKWEREMQQVISISKKCSREFATIAGSSQGNGPIFMNLNCVRFMWISQFPMLQYIICLSINNL